MVRLPEAMLLGNGQGPPGLPSARSGWLESGPAKGEMTVAVGGNSTLPLRGCQERAGFSVASGLFTTKRLMLCG